MATKTDPTFKKEAQSVQAYLLNHTGLALFGGCPTFLLYGTFQRPGSSTQDFDQALWESPWTNSNMSIQPSGKSDSSISCSLLLNVSKRGYQHVSNSLLWIIVVLTKRHTRVSYSIRFYPTWRVSPWKMAWFTYCVTDYPTMLTSHHSMGLDAKTLQAMHRRQRSVLLTDCCQLPTSQNRSLAHRTS